MYEINHKKYLTAQEVADRLSISLKTVYSLAQRGLIRSYKFGRLVRFDQADVDDYIKQSLRIPQPSPKTTAGPQPDPGVTA
jgi:putative molybdopterin biosynthesis protein